MLLEERKWFSNLKMIFMELSNFFEPSLSSFLLPLAFRGVILLIALLAIYMDDILFMKNNTSLGVLTETKKYLK